MESSVAATTEPPPAAMADVPGVCELPLTRAVVQYRDVHELYHPGGRILDIGLAVVVSGKVASSARAVDLGSADVKYLNLSSELVILDWVYDPTVAHLRLLTEAAEGRSQTAAARMRRYCFDLAIRLLNRRGFTPLTRPILLRMGFRDLCRDLDLHESTTVRIVTAPGRVTRVHLDYDANALVFRTSRAAADPALERALAQAFPGQSLGRARERGAGGRRAYYVRLGVPVTFAEVLRSLDAARAGLNHLVARFEPERYRAVRGLVGTFGERATLDRLAFPDAAGRGLDRVRHDAFGMAVH